VRKCQQQRNIKEDIMTRKTNTKAKTTNPPTSEAAAPAIQAETLFIPLNKLKKSPKNVRKVPHGKPEIEALAASLAAKGLLQNLVVEPERSKDGSETGCYLVTIGEGRRLAHLLRAKRKEIPKDAPVRCMLDTTHNPQEISLAENIIRTAMHPADQYEAFAKLHREDGMSAEDIAARFGVTATVVKQRLKLGAVSPVLMKAYRDGELNLNALTAFAITDDPAAQERVWQELPEYAHDRAAIMKALSEGQVPSDDRRAVFVGAEAYQAAGGAIIRDLFDEEGGGFFTDPALLNRLVRGKLEAEAEKLRAEGWKWVTVEPEYDYAKTADMHRVYPDPVELSEEDEARREKLAEEYDALAEDFDGEDEAIAAKLESLDAEIESFDTEVFRAEDIAIAGTVVSLGRDGTPRIERGLVRPEHAPVVEGDDAVDDSATPTPAKQHGGLSDKLVADLTAQRTAALRNELALHTDMALTAVVHALALATFYGGGARHSCLDLRPVSAFLTRHAPGIDETEAGRAIAARHEAWAARLPEFPANTWEFVCGLDIAERLDLLAHCASLSLDAVIEPKQRDRASENHADTLARAIGLDMRRYWQATGESYLGRVSKNAILEAVAEGASKEAADNIAKLKKPAMVEAAEQRIKGKGWLPEMLRPPVVVTIDADGCCSDLPTQTSAEVEVAA
jgi:ParB family chromosome partitioning protein